MDRTLITGGIVVPVDGSKTVLNDGSVLVDDDEIVAVGPSETLRTDYVADETVDVEGSIVLPGFVNVHSHSGIIRGLAEDLPVFEWLDEHVDPTYEALEAPEARAAYLLCFAENVRAGITCTLDMWQHMREAVTVAEEYGLRTVLVPYVADETDYSYLQSLEENVALVEDSHGAADGRIHVWFGIEHLTYSSKELMTEAFDYAAEYDVGFHTHAEEAKSMAKEIEKEYGARPIELFDRWGILDSRTHLAHCVWATDEEIDLLAETDASVAHCPTSNAKLASGVAPVSKMRDRGVTVGLGSDGIKANNRIDLVQEMKMAALFQKVHQLDPTLVPAHDALRMATIDGARALGLEDSIGSLEPRKKADITIIDANTFHMSPILAGEYDNIIPNVVHAIQAGDVNSVMVDGRFLLRDGEFLPGDRGEIIAEHLEKSIQLLRRRDAD